MHLRHKPDDKGERAPTGVSAPFVVDSTAVTDNLAAIMKNSTIVVRIEYRTTEPVVPDALGGTAVPPGRLPESRPLDDYGSRPRPPFELSSGAGRLT